jgi:iron complex outermembrane receptor protein
MVNGNPMRDLVWAFGIFWKGLPVNNIERIEIIRGPGSALYGADASAGVINVITKTAGKIDDTEIGARVGSFDTQSAWMQTGGQWNGFDFAMTADVSTTDGHNPYIKADRQTVNNTGNSSAPEYVDYGWNNADLGLSIANDNWRVLGNYMRHDNLDTGMTGAGNIDPVTRANDERYDLDLLYNNKDFSDHWGVDAKIHYQNLNYSSNNGFQESPPSINNPQGMINQIRSAEQQVNFESSGLYSGFDKHSIRIGLGYEWDDLYHVDQKVNYNSDENIQLAGKSLVDISDTPDAFAPEKARNIKFLFMQDVWSIAKNWEITLGARYDNYSDFGTTFNPRVALVWQATQKLTTKLLYGQGFRAPSFQELYSDTSRTLANSSLDAEQSATKEIVFSYKMTDDLRFDLNIYQLKYTDFISPTLVAGESLPQFKNTGSHKIFGTEAEVHWQLTRNIGLRGNYTYRNPDDNEFRVFQEPAQEAYFRADWRFMPQWNWDVQLNWIADRDRKEGDPRSDIDDYSITDTTLRYDGLKNWEFAGSIRNVFNEDAREATGTSIPNDFPLAERSFYAQATYKF